VNENDDDIARLFARVRRPACEGGRWPIVRARIGGRLSRWLLLLALFPAVRLLLLAGGFPAVSALKLAPLALAGLLFVLLRVNPFRVEPLLAGDER
jgi:hypothetical protein